MLIHRLLEFAGSLRFTPATAAPMPLLTGSQTPQTSCIVSSTIVGTVHLGKISMNTAMSIQELLQPLFPGLMGVQLTEVTPEWVVGAMEVRPDLCTTGEVLHGGAIMAFADTLGAVATVVNLPQGTRTTTIESKTNFLRAAPLGSRVIGECSALHRGRTTMVWQTLVKSEAGQLCAVVIQTQMVLPV